LDNFKHEVFEIIQTRQTRKAGMKTRHKWLPNNAAHFLAAVISLLLLLPLLWMLLGSLAESGAPARTLGEVLASVSLQAAGENYARVFQIVPMGRYFVNSLIVTGIAVPLTLLTASWAGFGMAQLPRRGRRFLLGLSLILLMTPVTALWLTRFLLFAWLGVSNSYLPLIAPALMGSSPLFILLFYWNFRRIPAEMFEAARLEGANAWTNWRWVALPQSRPVIVAVALLSFLFYWNDFINPLIYLRSQRLYTLALGLQQITAMDKTNFPLMLAAALVMTLPALLVFLLVQRTLLGEGVKVKS
jgi:multiple sugar transport system permease protein